MKPIYRKYIITFVLLWGCSFLILLAVFWFLLVPQKQAMELVGNELAEKKFEYSRAKYASSYDSQVLWNRKLEDLNEHLGQFIADANSLDNLNFAISKIAGDMRVEEFASRGTVGESYSEILNCEYIGRAETTVVFKSSFNKLAALINVLERHQPVIFIEQFSILQTTKGDSKHRVNLILSVLVRKPAEEQTEEEAIEKDI